MAELVTAAGTDNDTVEVLSVIRSFDPAGVGAEDLRECCSRRKGRIDSPEYRVVDQHMDFRRRFRDCQALGVEIDEVQDIARSLRSWIRPGSAFRETADQYVVPEVFVAFRMINGR